MGAIADVMALEDQDKLDQQAAAANARPVSPVKVDAFHKGKLPTSVFPKGLKADGQFRVVPDQLNSVKAQMAKDLGRLQSTLSQLVSYGAFGSAVGGWETADCFGSNALNAYEAITQFMQALNSAYDLVASNVGKAAQNYSDADATTASAASRVGTDAAPGGLG
jgi:uncharacterized protein YukE